jgi:hypothetical protein
MEDGHRLKAGWWGWRLQRLKMSKAATRLVGAAED